MTWLSLPLAYFIGSLPFGVWIARGCGVDIRLVGSGNTGATNVWRSCGAGPGATTMLLDIAKGAVPVLIARLWAPDDSVLHLLTALCAVLGHVVSPWLGFKGGKGAATGCGALAGLAPIAAAVALAVFFLSIALTRYVSIGSLASSVAGALTITLLPNQPPAYRVVIWLAVVLIWVRHRGNIARLARGEEPKFQIGGKSASAPAAEPEPAASDDAAAADPGEAP